MPATSVRARPKLEDGVQRCEAIREQLGMSKDEFSLALGYVTGGGYPCALRDGVSLTLLLAAEGVLHRYGATNNKTKTYLLLTIEDGVCLRSDPVSPQTMTIGGKTYLLVDQPS